MIKYIHYSSLLVFFVLMLTSCGTIILVEKQKDFKWAKRIVSIEPMFDVVIIEEEDGNTVKSTEDFFEASQKQKILFDYMEGAAANSEIELEIIKSNNVEENDDKYFKYIVPLKKEILDVNQLQEFEGKDDRFLKKGTIITYYDEGPKIKEVYSGLEKEYGTRYFAVQGIKVSKKTVIDSPEVEKRVVSSKYYYTIIADVVTSQIVYSEYRILKPKTSGNSLKNIIYDSFLLIKR